jgi:hypothetical protein
MLAIAFGSQLVTLVAGSADSPSNRPSSADRASHWRSVGVLAVLWLRGPGKMRRRHSDVLLEVLDIVWRTMAKGV